MTDDSRELERLRAENAALNDQVKLLVQVEQRLYRSQNEYNRQLQNMRELGAFALSCSGLDDAPTILNRAVRVLASAFTLDWIAAIGIGADGRRHVISPGDQPQLRLEPDAIDEADVRWLAGFPSLHLFSLPESPESPMNAFVARIWPREVPPPAERPGNLLIMVLKGGGKNGDAILIAYSTERKRAMYWPADLSERNLPFLGLFASHLERALENASLTADLKERREELSASLGELERAQARLVQAQKMEAIGQLAGGIAHDFNNILTVILGHATLVLDSMAPDADRRRDIQSILAAGERAASITRQLLAFGRRQIQRRETIDLNRLTSAMAEMLERLIGEHIRLSLDLSPVNPLVRADPSQIEQVLLNLVVNSRDAMPSGGEIRIITRAAGHADTARCDGDVSAAGFAVLEVVDTGTGMDASTRARIFEPFYSTKEVGRGTGLGLAVVYGIIRQSDGHALVESAPGRGTRFTLLVPRSTEAAPVVAPSAAPVTEVSEGTVLLVEDEEMIRWMVREFLTRAGYTVYDAPDGQAALDMLRSRPTRIDLLISDVVMPRMGGPRLAEELRRDRSELPAVFMSGYSRDQPESGAPSAGQAGGGPASSFLLKPFSREQLLAVVREVLQRSRNPARKRRHDPR